MDELEEEVYMKLPKEITKEASKDKVCRLKKAIYRLKQRNTYWKYPAKDRICMLTSDRQKSIYT